jgi:AcrR family transcriptional regulator
VDEVEVYGVHIRVKEKSMATGRGVATGESGALTVGEMPRPPQAARAPARRRSGAVAGAKRMSRAAVVDAALRLVDRDGLDGVSMRRLAATLGATPMALYRHVPGKAALLDALVAAVLGQLEFPGDETLPLAERMRATVRSLRRLLHEHPWLVTLLLRGSVLNEGVYRASEIALRELRETGLDAATVAAAFRLLHSFTIGYVGMEIARRDVDPARYEEFEHRRYPTRAAIAAHLGPFGETQFEAALDVIVAGIDALSGRKLARRTRAKPRRRAR